jgi:DNA modification methylase
MELLLGNCLGRLKELKDNSVDAIVCDPPYGLSFMGKKWDYDVPSVEIWKECLRVLKPGGYLLSFAGTRTQHRMAVNIEDAGFEIRDMIAWVYGSGFPKSLNIGKAVDKLQGNRREIVGRYIAPDGKERGGMPNNLMDIANNQEGDRKEHKITKGASEWEGWGTALKPAVEPITVARKPLEKGLNVAQNCLKWGVGGINIDGCRVEMTEQDRAEVKAKANKKDTTNNIIKGYGNNTAQYGDWEMSRGRFPANLIHDGSEEVVGCFPQTKSGRLGIGHKSGNNFGVSNEDKKPNRISQEYGNDSGSAARFFYCSKASKRERNIGCEGLEKKANAGSYQFREDGSLDGKPTEPKSNFHPTVKPVALMEYLVKMVSREEQVVLDPFMGSGTTGMACKKLGREFIGIEMMPEYMEIAKCRIEGVEKESQLNML